MECSREVFLFYWQLFIKRFLSDFSDDDGDKDSDNDFQKMNRIIIWIMIP